MRDEVQEGGGEQPKDTRSQRGKKASEWGREAEQIASDYLVSHGYIIRERNWSPRGAHVEVDLISQRDNVIIFIEVKARKGDYEDPADAVDDRKMRRLTRAADIYMQSLTDDFEYRFDIITITGTPAEYTLDHIPDAFLPPLT